MLLGRTAPIQLVLALHLVGGLAAAATWDGSGDMTWTQPDSTSWSGATYNSGDSATFDGAGTGTVTVSGSVTPGSITFSSGTYVFDGGTIAGSGGVTKNGGTIALSSTNTYSGNTRVDGGWLTLRGKHAISPDTKLSFRGDDDRWDLTIRLLMDDAGTVNLANEVEMTGAAPYSYGTAIFTVHVGNNGGGTTGSTIALAKMDFTNPGGNHETARLLRSTGANGYQLQFGDVDLNTFFFGTMGGRYTGPQGFYSATAPITITGTIKQVNGNTGNVLANTLFLGGTGTTTTNYVTGLIKDADDYDDGSNTNAQPLNVWVGGMSSDNVPQSDAIWCLTGPNTYAGKTTVNYGTLIVDGGLVSECLADGTNLVIKSPGLVQLNDGVREVVGGLILESTQQAIGTWGSSSSRATYTNDIYFAGSGVLYVGLELPAIGSVLFVR